MSYHYPPDWLTALSAFGLAPRPETPPALVRDAVNDLYRYELRRARARLLRREFEKSAYLEVVIALRKKYWLLSLGQRQWQDIMQTKG